MLKKTHNNNNNKKNLEKIIILKFRHFWIVAQASPFI